MPKKQAKHAGSRSKSPLTIALVLLCGLLLVPLVQVLVIRFVDPPTTVPIILRKATSRPARYEWKEIDQISMVFLKHCLVAEDQRFFHHRGFDWREIRIARKEAERKGKPIRGASTITMQCARSLFLWQGRSWIRKGLEAYYTFLMELVLSKKRILELYANVIEMGDGIYGVEAGSRYYFGISAMKLTPEQSAMLVAVLPNPKRRNPRKPSPALSVRKEMILRRESGFVFPERLLR